MSHPIRILEPVALWNHFADLNAVPRPSKKEHRIIQFIKNFGESLKLETQTDAVGNILIRKPASPGMENRNTIVLQSHLDMVHQKNSNTSFDFEKQGIDMYVDSDWVKARGTTLGADNGIGVAAIMTLLASENIAHPPIEALFTIDEETGMTGALALKGGWLTGNILLNLDTEEDNELTIGCAGGVDVTASGSFIEEATTHDAALRISIKGLTGGHSGVDIHKGRANANKLMNRVLSDLIQTFSVSVVNIDGGSLRNAIPRESVAEITFSASHKKEIEKQLNALKATFKNENSFTDAGLELTSEQIDVPAKVMQAEFAKKLVAAIYACPNGIYRMTPSIEGLVQTSNNVARVLAKNGSWTVQCLSRSSVNSEKADLAMAIRSAFAGTGATVTESGAYPGWEPKPDAPIVKIMSDLYKEMFRENANVDAIHAGLECGIIGANYPDMQMISFGPNIYGAHSPDERVQISSVQKFWKYLLETLKKIPEKAA